jgi:histidinol-phosphate aminotransferase
MTYDRAPEPGPGLRLHLNENTAGCSAAVLAALRTLERTDAAFYPEYAAVTSDTARALGVPAEWVQLTNGLDEGLHVVALSARLTASPALMAPDGTAFDAVIVEPAFEMYRACASAVGGRVVPILPERNLAFPTATVLAAITPRVRLVHLCDPNNPSGLPLPDGALGAIAQAAPHALVVVDEAYADFSGHTAIGPALSRLRNVVVGRTFAKAHGLAGLRVGALVAHPDTLDPLRRLLPPYNLNVCAVRALSAALQDRAYLEWYVSEAAQSRLSIERFCRRLGVTYWPSQANFVLVRIGHDAPGLVAALASHGIYIRDRSGLPQCDGCIRITAGVVADTERCLAAMEDFFATRSR